MRELLMFGAVTRPPVVYPDGVPGPKTLSKGNSRLGLFGEVTGPEFMTYAELATAVNLTVGVVLNNATSRWIKIAYEGNVLLIPKMSVRHSVSWADLNTAGVVSAAQNKLIVVKGITYRVRLFNGSNANPWPGADDGTGGPYTLGTEWNRIMYGLMSTLVSQNDLEYGAIAAYTVADMGLGPISILGTSILIKETASNGQSVVRGNGSGAFKGLYHYAALTATDSYRGWRPILEYVSG